MAAMLATVGIVVVLVLVAALLRTRAGMRALGRQVEALQASLETLGSTRDPAGTEVDEAATLPVPVITDLSRPSGRGDAPVTSGRVVSVTFASPMIKVVALVFGLCRALDDEHRMRVSYAFRRELKRQRRQRRRAAAARARQTAGWLS